MVREQRILRPTEVGNSVHLDGFGPGASVWPGAVPYVHHYRESSLRASPAFLRAVVKQLQLLFDELQISSFRSLLPPTGPLVHTMRATVESCDNSSSEDSLVRLSPVESRPSLHLQPNLHWLSVSLHQRTGASASWSLVLQGRLNHATYSPDWLSQISASRVSDSCHTLTHFHWIVCRDTLPRPSVPGHQLIGIRFWRSAPRPPCRSPKHRRADPLRGRPRHTYRRLLRSCRRQRPSDVS